MDTFALQSRRAAWRDKEWFRVLAGLILALSLIVAVAVTLGGQNSGTHESSLTASEAAERGREGEELGPPHHSPPMNEAAFEKWYRTASEIDWFGSPVFKKTGPMDKTKYLTRPDCAAAEDAGVVHITKDCIFLCEACEGTTVRINCHTLSDGYCADCADVPCPPTHFRVNCGGLEQGTCQPCEHCGHGYFRSGCGGLDAGECTRCQHCGHDKYNLGCGGFEAGTCAVCPACQVDFFRQGCEGVSVGECVPCEPCAADAYEVSACKKDEDRQCAACSSLQPCPSDKYRVGCGNGNIGTCFACPDCPAGSFREGCELQSVGSCSPCQECGPGRFVSGCSGTAPGECMDCALCPAGSYRSGCAGWEAGECLECAVCGAEEYETAACEGMQNRQCGHCDMLADCGVGALRRACGGGSPGQCEGCAECAEGEYRVGCGGRAEGECVACGPCSEGEYREGCSGLSAGQCVACQQCAAGTVLQGCAGLHRGACVPCSSIPCPEGQERVECGGTEEGRCESLWGSESIPPEEIVWSQHLEASECVVFDAGGGDAAEETVWTRNTLLRLGDCTAGEASGSYELPWEGDWAVSFYVGVPSYKADAKPQPAWFPLEGVGQPDATDSLTVTINGQSETLRNTMGGGQGDKLVVTKRFEGTRSLHFSFVFASSNDRTPLHLFASNGEATFLGDGISRASAATHLEEGHGRLQGTVVDACDGSVLAPQKKVSDGYEEKLQLPNEEPQVGMMVGTTNEVDVQVSGGRYGQQLQAGSYACQATFPGFYTFFDPDCHLGPAGLHKVMPLCPFMNPGHGRFIMTWGSSPADMDLMLHVPSGLGAGQSDSCRVDYQHRYCQGKKVRLDYDVIRAYGPETITIEGFIPGKYIVHVRHYGGHRFVDRRTNLDPMLVSSQTAVTFYSGQRAQRFEVGKHGYLEREDWMVLLLDGASGQIQLCTPTLCPRPT